MTQTSNIIHATLLALVLSSAPAFAAQPAVVDLNSIAQTDKACRLTFTVTADQGLSELQTQTVLFDQDGAVQTFTLFDFGAVPSQGVRVRQFDMPQTQCDDIKMVLFNEVSICTTTDGAACTVLPTFSSRVDTMEVQQ
ncbi:MULTISPECIES: hypothetical protein [Pacificibacter]|uniref:hypothetical protein n=1 Tax=Pacificibacter TaxID=1042323 RepID=UPI001C09F827|nr:MULTISPECIES: hypothetical protein [Pacificibacter]MBU2937774.1 hypothetical protein [Pacificibacter marinus]MDO6616035.1 hypothetical protein [Pacificibacter sp. 1_MG-2023]